MKTNSLLLALLVNTFVSFAADVDITPGISTLIDSTPAAISQWVSPGPQGKLLYKTTERGDKIMDFSQAGYRGGGVAIPTPPVKITLSPSPGDNTDAIQQAIDQVSKMPMQNGSRGAVLLTPGVYPCDRTLKILASGVVLRGSGPGQQGTTLQLTGAPHTCITVKGGVTYQTKGEPAKLADPYVPSGTNSFTLTEASRFAVGDTIRIIRPVTDAWIRFMGMNELVRNGKKQTWLNGEISTDRVIRKIEKNKVTVDVPLTDSYDAKYLDPPGVTVTKVASTGELSDIGIENFRIVSPDQTGTIDEHHHNAFSFGGLTDGWARNIEVFNTVNSISITGRRITLDNIHITHNLPTTGAAKPADLNGSGSQLLFNQCTVTGDNLFFFATGAKVSGPIVLLNCTFRGNGWIQPHQRWATGLLVDGCSVPDGGIDFMNRGEMGSGHGWAIGWAVAWNCKAKSFLNQQPPGAANWVIGSQGEPQRRAIPFETQPLLPEGLYDAHGKPVTPASLYLAQLAERLGPGALSYIGYSEVAPVR
ncbi:MAG TPA: hypothetical protein VL832_07020 [Puia sp.]|nr:hypothetical protein [Puia sp.]